MVYSIEHLGKLRKRQSALVGKGKQKAKEVAASVGVVSDADRREILEGRKKAKAKAEEEKTVGDNEQGPSEKKSSSIIEKAKVDSPENNAQQSSPKENGTRDKETAIGNDSAGPTKSTPEAEGHTEATKSEESNGLQKPVLHDSSTKSPSQNDGDESKGMDKGEAPTLDATGIDPSPAQNTEESPQST